VTSLSIPMTHGASIPPQNFVAYIGELSAALTRRADDGISGIFRGGQTSQCRREPTRYVTTFWDGTLAVYSGGMEYSSRAA
jgi:hypothetical protein